MRVLVMSRAQSTDAHVRLLSNIGAGLAVRGSTVAYAAGPARSVAAMFAGADAVNLHTIDDMSPVRALLSMRRALSRFRPDVVITDSERDTLLAAVAGMGRVGIVRRLRTGQDAAYRWRSRLAARFAPIVMLAPSSGETLSIPRSVRTVRAPVALPESAHVALRTANDVGTPTTIACVPDVRGASAALCLRAFAKLHRRRPDLTLLLLGDATRMQAVRVHAAALGLTDHVHTLPETALFDRRPLPLLLVWIATSGDDGALAAVASMERGLPVVAERNSDVAAFIAHRITGLHVDESDLSSTIASIAQLLADPPTFRSTCDAAIARAQRLHSWNGFLDRVVEAIELTQQPRRNARRT